MADVVFTGWIRAMYWHGIFHVLSGPNQTKARTRNWSSEWDLCTKTAPRCSKSLDWEIHPPGCHHWVVSFMTNILTNWTCADTRIICRYHLSLYSTMCIRHFAFWCMLNLLHLSVQQFGFLTKYMENPFLSFSYFRHHRPNVWHFSLIFATSPGSWSDYCPNVWHFSNKKAITWLIWMNIGRLTV